MIRSSLLRGGPPRHKQDVHGGQTSGGQKSLKPSEKNATDISRAKFPIRLLKLIHMLR